MGRSLRLVHVDGNLSPSQREVLFTITRSGPVRLSQVAASEGINPTMLSRIIGKFESDGLATRLADSADGRVVHVAATKKGRDLVARIRRERSDALRLALEGLSKDDLQALSAALPVLESLAERLKDRPS